MGEGVSAAAKVRERLYCIPKKSGGEGEAADAMSEPIATGRSVGLSGWAAVMVCLRSRDSSNALSFWRASSAADPPLAQTEERLCEGGAMLQFNEALLGVLDDTLQELGPSLVAKMGSDFGASLSLISSRRRWRRELDGPAAGMHSTLERGVGLDILKRDAMRDRQCG